MDIDKLREKYEAAEAKAHKIQADKDEALQNVRDRFGDKLRKANDDTAAAQKELADAEAAQALADREGISDEERQRIADQLGLTLPDA